MSERWVRKRDGLLGNHMYVPQCQGQAQSWTMETFRVLTLSFFTKAKTEWHIQNVSLYRICYVSSFQKSYCQVVNSNLIAYKDKAGKLYTTMYNNR